MSDIRQWLDYSHLLLNETKTEAIVFRSSAVHSPSSLSTICVCGSSISLSLTVRDIGVLLDSRLDMSAQVSNVCRAACSNLFRIAKIRTSLTTAACKTLVHALVTSRLDYGNAVLYGISDRLLHRLEMVQRSAARVVLRLRRDDRRSMTAALKQLHWLPVKYRIEYKILVIVFRALHERTPAYIASLITPYVPRRALRSADRALLVVGAHGGRSGHLVLFLVALLFSKLQAFLNNNPEGNPLKSVYLTSKIALKFGRIGCQNGRLVTIAICFSHSLLRATKLVVMANYSYCRGT